MPRIIGRLSALTVSRLKDKGRYPDGGGLYLQVSAAGTRSWLFRFMLDGRARQMGLGPLHTITLAEARTRATACRQLCLDGIDPIERRRRSRQQARLEAAKAITFKAAADAYVKSHKSGWRNAKHAAQWQSTLKTYADPIFGSQPIQAIDPDQVMKVLEPIWATKTETASRLRGRIEAVLNWAATHGYRTGENPARWRGHLENLLPNRTKVRRVAHHAALPYSEIPTFVKTLRGQHGTAAEALEVLILTATRTSEIIGARWDEVDLEDKVWTIPAARMKAGKSHRIPLSAPAVAVLKKLREARASEFVFPGGKANSPLSNMALLALLDRMNRRDATVHGFRSAFRDWTAETTTHPREVAEMALAHAVSDKVEAAYRRGDLFDKRRELMDAWGGYCSGIRAPRDTVARARDDSAPERTRNEPVTP